MEQADEGYFMNRLSIIIPAYNEEQRIGRTLHAYAAYAQQRQAEQRLQTELLVVLNGCKDNTEAVVQQAQEQFPDIIRYITSPKAGKGLAVIAGFNDALTRPNDLIGFVDADMATAPAYFYQLVDEIADHDGVIASRYMPGAQVFPPRPKIKDWGRKIFYNRKVRKLFGLNLYDYQCGAKLFTRAAVQAVIVHMSEGQWAFDVELLYLMHRNGATLREIPTVWHDQEGSKLATFGAGIKMLGALDRLHEHHQKTPLVRNK
jgi:glycosyltransferase involved in cell wall biosynthesis